MWHFKVPARYESNSTRLVFVTDPGSASRRYWWDAIFSPASSDKQPPAITRWWRVCIGQSTYIMPYVLQAGTSQRLYRRGVSNLTFSPGLSFPSFLFPEQEPWWSTGGSRSGRGKKVEQSWCVLAGKWTKGAGTEAVFRSCWILWQTIWMLL